MLRLNLINCLYVTKTFNSYYYVVNDHKAGVKYFNRIKKMVEWYWIRKYQFEKQCFINPHQIDHFEKEENPDVPENSFIIHFKDGQRFRVWPEEFKEAEWKEKLPKSLYKQLGKIFPEYPSGKTI